MKYSIDDKKLIKFIEENDVLVSPKSNRTGKWLVRVDIDYYGIDGPLYYGETFREAIEEAYADAHTYGRSCPKCKFNFREWLATIIRGRTS